ncbi:hypothetical protein [Jiulongibacter sediminis]|uniref:hypothetical protein n=1 Tax=Jiulongibacter sediminis TaxID=1605367 RepID=UPI0026F1BC1B|nr:hypothetical protein [Jiulongibacter sediminis]
MTIFLFLGINSFAQKSQKLTLSLGAGSSLMGTGDFRHRSLENELTYELNRYLTIRFSTLYGNSKHGVGAYQSYFQGNINAFVSPFKNNRRNDFRLGTGVSRMSVTQFTEYYDIPFNPNQPIDRYSIGEHRSGGTSINLIIEDKFEIFQRLSLGLKAFTQPFSRGDINTGILLKMGVSF